MQLALQALAKDTTQDPLGIMDTVLAKLVLVQVPQAQEHTEVTPALWVTFNNPSNLT